MDVEENNDDQPFGSSSSSSRGTRTSLTATDKSLYGFEQQALEKALYQKLWMKDPKYFKRVKIAPSATIKMMAHAQSGVDKGVSRGGNPIEVMGLLVGRMDVEDPQCFVVTDACPVPAEGTHCKSVELIELDCICFAHFCPFLLALTPPPLFICVFIFLSSFVFCILIIYIIRNLIRI